MPIQRCEEQFRVTLLRTGLIAVIVGAVIAISTHRLSRWPAMTLLALWPALGGHYVEVAYRNWIYPRLSDSRMIQIGVRILVWFIGGLLLAAAMTLTATAMGFTLMRLSPWGPTWWLGGVGFIVLELVVHLFLQVAGRGSAYDGRR